MMFELCCRSISDSMSITILISSFRKLRQRKLSLLFVKNFNYCKGAANSSLADKLCASEIHVSLQVIGNKWDLYLDLLQAEYTEG